MGNLRRNLVIVSRDKEHIVSQEYSGEGNLFNWEEHIKKPKDKQDYWIEEYALDTTTRSGLTHIITIRRRFCSKMSDGTYYPKKFTYEDRDDIIIPITSSIHKALEEFLTDQSVFPKGS